MTPLAVFLVHHWCTVVESKAERAEKKYQVTEGNEQMKELFRWNVIILLSSREPISACLLTVTLSS
jgi:hypothetical protein